MFLRNFGNEIQVYMAHGVSRWRRDVSPKRRYLRMSLNGITNQKNKVNLTAVRTWNFLSNFVLSFGLQALSERFVHCSSPNCPAPPLFIFPYPPLPAPKNTGCRQHLCFISRHKVYGRNNRCVTQTMVHRLVSHRTTGPRCLRLRHSNRSGSVNRCWPVNRFCPSVFELISRNVMFNEITSRRRNCAETHVQHAVKHLRRNLSGNQILVNKVTTEVWWGCAGCSADPGWECGGLSWPR